MKEAQEILNGMKSEIEVLKTKFAWVVNFYQIDPKSDQGKQSIDMFDAFKKFLKEIEANFPKEEKKRAGAAKNSNRAGLPSAM